MAWYDVAVRHEWMENFSNNTYFRHEKNGKLEVQTFRSIFKFILDVFYAL